MLNDEMAESKIAYTFSYIINSRIVKLTKFWMASVTFVKFLGKGSLRFFATSAEEMPRSSGQA